ncbi:MAG: metal ABC transporter substrate-binding protein [Oscillospiraceae bacterium]|nr:metal ABC transporter substrate-binding protein [Oscillospiraceae bacterium]
MKKLGYIILSLLILLAGFSSCKAFTAADKGFNIVTTGFAPYDFARQITAGKADLTMLLSPGAESHSYDPSPQDIIKIQKSKIFIYVGGESDAWVDKILDSIDTSKVKIITLMDCVELVEEETVDGMQEEAEEEEEPAYDEHVWTSPRNAKLIVQKLSEALCELDTANAEEYKKNTAAYLEKLDALDAKFKAVVAEGSRKTIIFGDRFPFRYFADAYGLTYYAAFPGCSTETEPSAATVKFLIDKVKAEKIPVVFHIEMGNEKMTKVISEATGAKVLQLHACHNISRDDFKNGVSYLDIMEKNADALKEALA